MFFREPERIDCWNQALTTCGGIQDECPETNRVNFLESIGQLEPFVRIFLTSRPHVDLREHFTNTCCINIAANVSDIKAYLAYKINKSSRIAMFTRKDTKLGEDIIEILSQKAAGM